MVKNQQRIFSLINQSEKVCARLTYEIFKKENLVKVTFYSIPKECIGSGLLYELFIRFAEKAYSFGCNKISIPFTNLVPYQIASDVFDFGERIVQPKCLIEKFLIDDKSESLNLKEPLGLVICWQFNPKDLNDG